MGAWPPENLFNDIINLLGSFSSDLWWRIVFKFSRGKIGISFFRRARVIWPIGTRRCGDWLTCQNITQEDPGATEHPPGRNFWSFFSRNSRKLQDLGGKRRKNSGGDLAHVRVGGWQIFAWVNSKRVCRRPSWRLHRETFVIPQKSISV